ncbi:8-oxo-dGTP diphosphatase [Allobranchiibius sp. CTAmp26]|uniref:8-oxo-dGTP diphosphatase n=1 Tax=Allobranchiibius sp. CTAmp26 TaxID=2815214 RepID=UPI001FB82051|nr:8-oxo-dGTP diphosphatase [Allobranchiibius sp. CTAmp26]
MLLRRDDDLLLGEKLTGFGAGRVVAPGGHVEPGEAPLAAAVRETREETGLVVRDVTACARLEFTFPARPAWDLQLEVFTSTSYAGELTPSSELAPWWCPVDELPLDRMWDDDHYWLARVLSGERLRGGFTYAPDNETVQHADLQPLEVTNR